MERIQKVYQIYDTVKSHLSKESIGYDQEKLNQLLANIYSPGPSFQYIFDFNKRDFDFVSEGLKEVLGIAPKDFTPGIFMDTIHPEDFPHFQKCEEVASHFLFEFMERWQIQGYKVSYLFRAKHVNGSYKMLLHQVVTLSIDPKGNISRVLANHSDISHITTINNYTISFIDIFGANSFFNISEVEDLYQQRQEVPIQFTPREIQVLKLVSEGLSTQKISKELNISYHTARTHRNNILKKSDFKTIPEVITYCIKKGFF